jgi:hypothetical protein
MDGPAKMVADQSFLGPRVEDGAGKGYGEIRSLEKDRKGTSDHLAWRKSSYSSNGGCVEVAAAADRIFVRDSKDRDGPVLNFNLLEWRMFLAGVRDGEFDLSS